MKKQVIIFALPLLVFAYAGLAQTPFLFNQEQHGIDIVNPQLPAVPPQPSTALHQRSAWSAATDTVFRIQSYSSGYLVIAKNGLFRAADTSTGLANLNAPFPTNIRSIVLTFPTLLGWSTQNYNGVFRSLNNGASWAPLNIPVPLNLGTIFTDATGNIFVYDNALYRSSDNGSNWSRLNTGFNTTGYRFFPGGTAGHLFAANSLGGSPSSGLFRTIDNGDTWVKLPLPLPTGHRVFTLSVRSNALAFAITDSNFVQTTRRLYRSIDNGQTWILATVPQATNLSFSPTPGTIFVTSLDGTVRRSIDNEQTWTLMSLPGISSFVPLWFSGNNVFAFNSTQGNVAFFRSTNNGDTWENLNAPLRDWNFLRLSFPIYVTGDSSVYRFGTDNRWARFAFPEPLGPDLAVGLSGASPYFLVFGWRSDPALGTIVGQTNVWQLRDDVGAWRKAALPDQTRFLWIRALLSAGNFYYLGTLNTGVLRSTDYGLTWTPLLPIPTSVAEANRPIQNFSLQQNYPNPFWSGATSRAVRNSSTQISFALPSAQKVTLKVYNLAGQEVATLLHNEPKAAGVHEIRFEAQALPSGMYFYRLEAKGFVMTKKILLVR